MLQHYSQKHSEEERTKLESIVIGYQPPACQTYVLHVQGECEARWEDPCTGDRGGGVCVEWSKLYKFEHVGVGGSCIVMSSVSWAFQHYSEKCSVENRTKQESILLGYQLHACQSYMFHFQWYEVTPGGRVPVQGPSGVSVQ